MTKEDKQNLQRFLVKGAETTLDIFDIAKRTSGADRDGTRARLFAIAVTDLEKAFVMAKHVVDLAPTED